MRAAFKRRFILFLCVSFFAACGGGGSPAPQSGPTPSGGNFLQDGSVGITTLQGWYVQDTGLWQTTGWWNAANALTVLVRYSRLSGSSQYQSVVSNTFTRNESGGFLNNYYDDEGWWALAWIAAYDWTGNSSYLSMANQIFTDMTTGWDTTCGGGVWWNKNRQYKNAIANELFLTVAARLANRATDPQQKAVDLSWAQNEWQWFSHSGMINTQNLINDGLNSNCANNQGTVWSYNQGVILGGLTAFSKLTQNSSLLQQAQMIALAAIADLTDSKGILHDACEPNCGGDGVQFKGIFVRNLAALDSALPNPQYATFLTANAQSIWANDQGSNFEFGQVWSGPYESANAASQTSAVDAFLAAYEASTGNH